MSDQLGLSPKLRSPLDMRIEQIPQGEVLILTCPIGVTDQPLVLVAATAPIVACLDGTRTVRQITEHFAQFGAKAELILDIVGILDRHLFLENQRYQEAYQAVRQEFAQKSNRPAALAGRGYAATRDGLEQEIDRYLSEGEDRSEVGESKLVGLVSPHVDYKRGGSVYGKTYPHLANQKHHTYLLLGTGHQQGNRLFNLSRKNFETPLGTARCDTSFVDAFVDRFGTQNCFDDELLHLKEHSLELQLPFLLRVEPQAQIVPILVGSFHHYLSGQRTPEDDPEFEEFVSALVSTIQAWEADGKSVCLIAGIDMAHIGKAFGDTETLTDEWLAEVKERDLLYLDAVGEQDKEKLFDRIAFDRDCNRVCGFPTLYTVIDLLDRLGVTYSTKLYDYQQAVNQQTQCAVTFAGLGIYK